MTKFKKLMALAAVSMLGIQMLGVGTAFATNDSDCDFGSDNLEITLADNDVEIYVDEDGMLNCDYKTGGSQVDPEAVASIDSITVEMDDDESDANLIIRLDDDGSGDDVYASDWPEFDTFDIDITSRLVFDGSSVDDAAGNKLRVTVGKSTFSFSGTSGTYAAGAIEFADGGDDDVFDASKATVRVYSNDTNSVVTGALSGDDVYKGGSGNDKFDLSGYTSTDDSVVVYGNAGNDLIKTGAGNDQGWGGDGADTIDLDGDTKDVAAPGAGDDSIESSARISYADLTGGIEYYGKTSSADVSTGGAAGDDEFEGFEPTYLVGSQGDDVISDGNGDLTTVSAGAGDDVVKVSANDGGDDEDETVPEVGAYVLGGAGDDLIVALDAGGNAEDAFYGMAGNDILKGKGGNDTLRGGPGKDQAWGGGGSADLCTAEVLNRCELIKH